MDQDYEFKFYFEHRIEEIQWVKLKLGGYLQNIKKPNNHNTNAQ